VTSQDAAAGEPRPAGDSAAAGDASGRSARTWPLSRKTIVIRAVALAAAGLAIYLLLPSLTRVLAAWSSASLGGLLVLAGVHGGDALLATLAYRLASYWLPLSAGLPAYFLYRHRYGRWEHRSRH
jgi:hypothetical protein